MDFVSELSFVGQVLRSIVFLPAILGPEMAAPQKILVLDGGILGAGEEESANLIFMGVGIF